MARYTIELTGVSGTGYHGVHAFERRDGQVFVVDAVLEVVRPDSDDVATTVDYGVVAAGIAADIAGEPVDLIESLAERVAATCLAHSAVESVRVTVHKPQAPLPVAVAGVAVSVTRRRSGT